MSGSSGENEQNSSPSRYRKTGKATNHYPSQPFNNDARETHENRFGPHAWFDPTGSMWVAPLIVSLIYNTTLTLYRVYPIKHNLISVVLYNLFVQIFISSLESGDSCLRKYTALLRKYTALLSEYIQMSMLPIHNSVCNRDTGHMVLATV